MFLGFSGLVNPAAIQLTKANAFQAAKVVLGLNAPTTTLLRVADSYTRFVIPQTNRALSVQQILGDVNFSRFISEGKDATDAKTGKLDKILGGDSHDFSLGGSALFGLPNWLLYGGAGYVAYRAYKKHKTTGKWFGGATPAAAVPTAIPVKG